ncbi:Arc family DNA-binding protein [Psychroflexus aestuariivivens]|uniref:Arc family DNA-binding protein n=1 Tax=Psychroflexus aestuariivivens TaxID=1795040 RepID=UPI000FDC0BF5|nr:toxin-antitoxin system HicB family antitoxin [Psychroflexus aestuariivivens]
MSTKIQTAVRLDKDLLEALKEKAKADHRSLNNYIEKLLHKDVGSIPNDATKAANSN